MQAAVFPGNLAVFNEKDSTVPILGRNITKCFEKGRFISTFDSKPGLQSREECLNFEYIRMASNASRVIVAIAISASSMEAYSRHICEFNHRSKVAINSQRQND